MPLDRTLYYLAPEVARQRYGAEADAWSAGVMLYQLLAGRLPFRDEENEEPTTKGVLASILYSRLDLESPPWDRVSVAAKHLVRSLLERDVRKRLTVEGALNHYWFRGAAPDVPFDEAVVEGLTRFGRFRWVHAAAAPGGAED